MKIKNVLVGLLIIVASNSYSQGNIGYSRVSQLPNNGWWKVQLYAIDFTGPRNTIGYLPAGYNGSFSMKFSIDNDHFRMHSCPTTPISTGCFNLAPNINYNTVKLPSNIATTITLNRTTINDGDYIEYFWKPKTSDNYIGQIASNSPSFEITYFEFFTEQNPTGKTLNVRVYETTKPTQATGVYYTFSKVL